jgi:hypothetical protein
MLDYKILSPKNTAIGEEGWDKTLPLVRRGGIKHCHW